MASNIQLVSLRCEKCSQPLSGNAKSLFLYCPECGAGYEIVNQQQLQSTPVYFAREKKNNVDFLPFWAFDATLQLGKREGKGGFFSSPKGLIHLFEERQTLRFYIPAFTRDLNEKDPAALRLTYEQPELEFLHPQKSLPFVEISQEDARKVADYLLISSEIEQKDTLRSLQYQLNLQNPMLIAIAL
jgi:hypothetical protein